MPLPSTVLSNNILKRSFDESIPVTPMKLQKLLYFICCEYVKSTGYDLISEDFNVWKYGPVIPAVYAEFKSFGSLPITKFATDVNGVAYAADETKSVHLKKAIDSVWNNFKNFTGVNLSQITHKDGSGWSNAFERHGNKITKEDMKADETYEEYLLI